MPADNSHLIVAAARRRSTAPRRRAVAALRRMDAAGTVITFENVAREAGLSRFLDLQPAGPASRDRTPPGPAPCPRDEARSRPATSLRRLPAATPGGGHHPQPATGTRE